MTLILTRVACDGVVMAADSALTEEYGNQIRILDGAKKLFVHAPSSSCIGTFGGGTLPNRDSTAAPIALEFVITEFVETAVSITTGKELVAKLADWLSNEFLATKSYIGLDVATVRPQSGISLPAVYRLTNAMTPDMEPTRFFKSHQLRAPVDYDDDIDQTIITAGDQNASFWVEEFHAASRRANGRGGTGPLPNDINHLSAWLPSLVRGVSDAYRVLQIGQSISGQVSCVALNAVDGTATLFSNS